MTSPVSGGFQFTPVTGLNDASAYPTVPANEAAARQMWMDLYWQLLNEMNKPTLSAAANAQYNKLNNSNFDVWQRGTSFTNPANSSYTADRWAVSYNGSGQVATISQQAFTPGQGVVPNEPKYFLRYQVTTAGTGQTVNALLQRMESVRSFAGQKMTMSFWAKADSARSVTPRIVQNFGSGGSASVLISGSPVNLTTSWQKFTATFDVPTISGKTIGTSDYLEIDFLLPIGVVMIIDLSEVQVNAGDIALPFQPRDIEEETRKSQRYLFIPGTTAGLSGYKATVVSADTLIFSIPVPTTLRTTPSIINNIESTHWNIRTSNSVVVTGFALSINSYNGNTIVLSATKTAHGLDTTAYFSPNSNLFGFDAEL